MRKKYRDLGDLDGLDDFELEDDHMDMIEEVTRGFKDKSDDEIFIEIINLNEQMENDLSLEEYEAIFDQLDSIRDLLSEDQLEKLDKILKHLGR